MVRLRIKARCDVKCFRHDFDLSSAVSIHSVGYDVVDLELTLAVLSITVSQDVRICS